MSPKTILRMAKPFKAAIGAHQRIDYLTNGDSNAWHAAQRDSDAAVSLASYLIQHLDNRHDAALFARAVGMPGYINLR